MKREFDPERAFFDRKTLSMVWDSDQAWAETDSQGRIWLVVRFDGWPQRWVSYVHRRGFVQDPISCYWYSATFKKWDVTWLADLLSLEERAILRAAIRRRERKEDRAKDDVRAGRRQRMPGGGRKPLPPDVKRRHAGEARKAWRQKNLERELERQRHRRQTNKCAVRDNAPAGQMRDSQA